LDGVGYLFHPHQATVTAVVEVTSPAFLLRDPVDRNSRIAGWGRVLAASTRTGAIHQVQLLERSIPDDGSELKAYTDAHLTTEPTQLTLADAYRDLVGDLRGGADRHQTFLAITVDRAAAAPRIKAAGGQIAGLIHAWRQEYALLERLLPAAGLAVVDELSARRLAEVVRTAYDPASTSTIRPGQGVDPAACGPTAGREEWDHLRTDGAFHAVLWVAEWPRAHVAADVLWPVIFPSGVHRALSLFYQPFTRAQSESAIRAKHSEILQSSWLKEKLGRVETLADSKELDDVLNREAELLAGHAEVGLVGMITITASTLDALEADVTTIHAAATQASLDLRRVYGQQLQAFTAAALPIGIEVIA
ncbi:MAG: PrgI family protein, partial [Candidatus Nanopelagicales bacterium]|nr:PrgI family protein [Candidatus Nanopelagicales bacterium]